MGGHSEYEDWTQVIKEYPGTKIDRSVFGEQEFLGWTVLKASFLRRRNLACITKEGSRKLLVKDVLDGNKLLCGKGETVNLDDIEHCYNERMNNAMLGSVVLLEELAKSPTKTIRTLIAPGQYFIYHPPGDEQWLALVVKNHYSILECLLFRGEFDNTANLFKLSFGEPIRRTIMMGSIGMHPFSRQFKLHKNMISTLQTHALQEMCGNMAKTRKSKINFESILQRMPECLFLQPLTEGDNEIDEESVVELLNVQRDPSSPDRYGPAERPHFLLATVIATNNSTFEVKVVDDGNESTHFVDLSEGLMYAVGTAEKLGVERRGATDSNLALESIGGPRKCDKNVWRGYAEFLMDDQDSPYIRPIVIRNIHFGILAEFSFIDAMEEGSLLFPICNPRFLPLAFSSGGTIPVIFNRNRVNGQLLDELFEDERQDHIVHPTRYSDFPSNDIDMNYDNPVPVDNRQLIESLAETEEGGEQMEEGREEANEKMQSMKPSGGKGEEEEKEGKGEEEGKEEEDVKEEEKEGKGEEEEKEGTEEMEGKEDEKEKEGKEEMEGKEEEDVKEEEKEGTEEMEGKEDEKEKEEKEEMEGQEEEKGKEGTEEKEGKEEERADEMKELSPEKKTVKRAAMDVQESSESDGVKETPSDSVMPSPMKKMKMSVEMKKELPSDENQPHSATGSVTSSKKNIKETIGWSFRKKNPFQPSFSLRRKYYSMDNVREDNEPHEGSLSTGFKSPRRWLSSSKNRVQKRTSSLPPLPFHLASTETTNEEARESRGLWHDGRRTPVNRVMMTVKKEEKETSGEVPSPMNRTEIKTSELNCSVIASIGRRSIVGLNAASDSGERDGKSLPPPSATSSPDASRQNPPPLVDVISSEGKGGAQIEEGKIDDGDTGRVADRRIPSIGLHEDEGMDKIAVNDQMEMSTDDIPSCSNNHVISPVWKEEERGERETSRMDKSKDEVPSKRCRIDSPIYIGVEGDDEKPKRVPQRGEPLDPSMDLHEMTPFHRRLASRNPNVRGGCIRAPFVPKKRSPSVDEKLISGDEEMERIKMERVLKDLGLMKISDKVMVDVITPELMKNFRNPMEWNSLELQLFLDQFDVEQVLKDFVAEQDFDGMNFFSLKVEEILNEFPTLPEEKEFNEKIYIFTVVDKIKKICNDESMVFAPPPFNLYES